MPLQVCGGGKERSRVPGGWLGAMGIRLAESHGVARGQDFSPSRKRSPSLQMKWILAMLGLGTLAATLFIILEPEPSGVRAPGAKQAAPGTKPVRTE